MPIYTDKKSVAPRVFAETGIVAFGKYLSAASAKHIHEKPESSLSQGIIAKLGESLPRIVRQIADTKVVAGEPESNDVTVKVFIGTEEVTVNDEVVPAYINIFVAGNSGAKISSEGKLLEYVYAVTDAWLPAAVEDESGKKKAARRKPVKVKAEEIEILDPAHIEADPNENDDKIGEPEGDLGTNPSA